MNVQNFETFAENTVLALSNMNEMIKDIQNEAVVKAGSELDDLNKIVEKYQSRVEEVEILLKETNDVLTENNKKVAKMENKLDTLEFDDEGKLQELRKIYQRRIFFLCGNDASNPEYILFNRSLLAQIVRASCRERV